MKTQIKTSHIFITISFKKTLIIACLLGYVSVSLGQSSTENYVKETLYKVQTQTGLGILNNDGMIQSITYYDGLGRPKQSIGKQAGGDREDIFTPMVYDALGRQTKQYLPFADVNQVQSSLNFITQNTLLADLESYYLAKYPDDLDSNINPVNPYSETIFDNSANGTVLEQGAPGNAWAVDPTIDTDHTIKFIYDTNVLNEVKHFEVIFPTGNTERPQPFYLGYYSANELDKTTTKDENWQPNQFQPNDHTTEEFKDKQGRLILKRTYDNGFQYDTYYIYDDFGNLTYVLSPKGSDSILSLNAYSAFVQIVDSEDFIEKDKYGNPIVNSSGDLKITLDAVNNTINFDFNLNFASPAELLNGPIALLAESVPDMVIGTINQTGANYIVSVLNNFVNISGSGNVTQVTDNFLVDLPAYSPDDTILDDLCYQYHYDFRNRLVEKKIPGKGWEYIVYDRLDRAVLTQDANLREKDDWLFKKYDVLGRTVYTGLYSKLRSRIDVQDDVNNATNLHELKDENGSGVGGVLMFYTNGVYPTASLEVLTINYYDDYFFDSAGLVVPSQNAYGTDITQNTGTLATGSKVKALETSLWTTTIMGYDDKARPIYVATQNDFSSTTDSVDSNLDFVGKVLQTTTSHIKGINAAIVAIDDFTYDHAERLLTQKQEIVGQGQERIAENHYDEMGQLEKKDVGGETVFDGYTDVVGVIITEDINGDTIITKDGYNGWGNAGIATKGKFAGDGYVEWIKPQDDKHLMVGLSAVNVDANYSTITYAITLSSTGGIGVREDTDGDGVNEYIGYHGPYVAGDKFRVERSGNQILYIKNDAPPFYTSNNAITGPLLGDSSFNTDSGEIKNLTIASDNLNTVLQTVDYTYNIRGWLHKINDVEDIDDDLFTFKINYNNPSLGTPLFNGNISQTVWRTYNDYKDGVKDRGYHYNYDALNRITEALYTATGTPTNVNGHYNLKHVDYDKNGNIMVLRRSGTKDDGSYMDLMDVLDYTYTGNQLTDVLESGNHFEGFKDGASPQTGDYTYDANGNMLTDANKDIIDIKYNHLNLPTQVTTTNGNIQYFYDANGIKLRKTVNENGQSAISTIYAGNYIYEDNASGEVLKFFSHLEGYTELGGNGAYSYVYQFKDHLGNIRLSYSDANNDGTVVTGEILEENNYHPFGLKHRGYNNLNVGADFPYGYNGKEEQSELDLEWLDIKMRNYDPAIGRWMNIDPLAGLMTRHSPYNYAFDNPIYYIDPDGMAPRSSIVWHDDVVSRSGTEEDSSTTTASIEDDESGGDDIGRNKDNEIVYVTDGQTVTFDHPSGRSAQTEIGYIFTNDGTPIKVFKNLSSQKGFDTDCHGYSFIEGKYWINNDQIRALLNGDNYKEIQDGNIQEGDVVLQEDFNNGIHHSSIVSCTSGNCQNSSSIGIGGVEIMPTDRPIDETQAIMESALLSVMKRDIPLKNKFYRSLATDKVYTDEEIRQLRRKVYN